MIKLYFYYILPFAFNIFSNIKAYGYYSISDDNIFYKSTNFDEFDIDSVDYEVTINTKKKQEIIGFGAAFTQSAAYLYKKLSPQVKTEFLNSYFSEEGSNYSMIRLPIGTCDCSPYSYSFNDHEDDFEMEHFDTNLTGDEDVGLVNMVKDAKSKIEGHQGEMLLFGAVWSPPYWMKTNNSFYSTDWNCLKSESKYYHSLALYILKYLQSFSKKVNHSFWGISPQNEPFLFNQHDTEQCHYTFDEYFQFIGDHLGPLLESNYPNPPKIIALDDNKNNLAPVMHYYINHKKLKAWEYIYAFGTHIYYGLFGNQLKNFHITLQKPIFGSESGWFSYPDVPGKLNNYWRNDPVTNYIYDWKYFDDINTTFKYGGVAYIDWSILLDDRLNGMGGPNRQNLNALATTQVTKDFNLNYNSIYYLIKMFSANIQKGDRYVDFVYQRMGYTNELVGSAFYKKDGRYVFIVANLNEFDIKVKINFSSQHSFVNLYAKSYNVIYLTEYKNTEENYFTYLVYTMLIILSALIILLIVCKYLDMNYIDYRKQYNK